jgi:hypothetical protein
MISLLSSLIIIAIGRYDVSTKAMGYFMLESFSIYELTYQQKRYKVSSVGKIDNKVRTYQNMDRESTYDMEM